MSVVDPGTEVGRQAAERLPAERVCWLVTVSPAGRPAPTPVWFAWDGSDEVVVRSKPGQAKLRNIEANEHVAMHLNSTADGGRVLVLNGDASVDPDGLSDTERDRMLTKYAEAIESLGVDADGFLGGYSATIRIRLTGIRGF